MWAQVFSCEFYEISKNTFSYRTPLVAASVNHCEIVTIILSLEHRLFTANFDCLSSSSNEFQSKNETF